MSSEVTHQQKPIVLAVPLLLTALVLFMISLVSFFKNQYKLDAYSTVLTLVATFLISSGSLFKLFSKLEINLTGIKAEARELADSISTLSEQMKALGHLALFEQVSVLNRLVVERPELAKVWGMDKIEDREMIRQMFYIYCFLDTFEMMLCFKEGRLLCDETYELWRKEWISQLLECDAGKLMQKEGMLDYYTDRLKQACGISLETR